MASCAVLAVLSGWGGPSAAADATATAADTSVSSVEEIVVTAERRDESVEKVPLTIQAFTGTALNNLNVLTLDDLLKYTPNVTFAQNGPDQGEIYMRGLSSGFRGNQSSRRSPTSPMLLSTSTISRCRSPAATSISTWST